jgi:N-acetylmuramoyl-L-alanine amidase
MFEIGKVLLEKLQKDGRFTPKIMDKLTGGTEAETLVATVNTANTFNPDIYVSLHSDAGYNAHGCSVFAYSKNSKGADLAQCIYNTVSILTPWKDIGVTYRPELYELRKPKCPAVLCEVSFHDQKTEAQFIHYQKRQIADAIYVGILNYYHLQYPK